MTAARLTSLEMARFVADGMLRRDAVVPDELNRAVLDDVASGAIAFRWFPYQPAATALPSYGHLHDVFDLPAVKAMVNSLLGSDPVLDHVAVHANPAGWPGGQQWHSDDPVFDGRPGFDVQLYYYPHDVTVEMGGTLFLPGSHTRKVDEFGIGRYLNIVGQTQIVCPAGTVIATHHAIWHCAGRPNTSERERVALKVRLNRSQPQVRTWDTSDLDSREVALTLATPPVFLDHEGNLDHLQRILLWQRLTGDDSFDTIQGIHQRLTGPA